MTTFYIASRERLDDLGALLGTAPRAAVPHLAFEELLDWFAAFSPRDQDWSDIFPAVVYRAEMPASLRTGIVDVAFLLADPAERPFGRDFRDAFLYEVEDFTLRQVSWKHVAGQRDRRDPEFLLGEGDIFAADRGEELGRDRLSGGGGADWVIGQMGSDRLSGGRGDDILIGDLGRRYDVAGTEREDIPNEDLLRGGAGDDKLYGDGGKDRLFGGGGDDTLSGGDDFDRIVGGRGNDVIFAGYGGGEVRTGPGRDAIVVEQSPREIDPETGFLFSPEPTRVIDWQDGRDRILLEAEPEDVRVRSVDGDAVIFVRDFVEGFHPVAVVEDAGGTLDARDVNRIRLDWADTDYDLDDVVAAGGIGSRAGVFGESIRNDVSRGTRRDDLFTASPGNDVIVGRRGSDTIDYFERNGDPFFLQVDLAAGTIRDSYGDTDTVRSIENVIGTAEADTFVGNGRDNVFFGAGGNDRYTGGGGSDTFVFAAAPGAGGIGVIHDFEPGIDRIAFRAPTESGTDVALSNPFRGMNNPGFSSAYRRPWFEIERIAEETVRWRDLEISAFGFDTRITVGGSTIRLESVAPEDLSRDDFIFGF